MKKLALLVALVVICVAAFGQGKLQQDLSLKYLVSTPAPSKNKPPVIILMHGYGSNEEDLYGLKDHLPANFLVISVRAPYSRQPESGYQWYALTVENGKRSGSLTDIEKSRQQVSRFIDEVVRKYGADARNVYVMGFSQGAVMSYVTALAEPGKVHGIGALSGKIYTGWKSRVKPTPAMQQLKIFVAHGTQDNMIPYTEAKEAVTFLQSMGLKPDFHTYNGMGHTISNDVLKDLRTFLR